MGEWTRDRTLSLAGMAAVAAVGIGLVVFVDDIEFKALGGFLAILGFVGAGIALFRWNR